MCLCVWGGIRRVRLSKGRRGDPRYAEHSPKLYLSASFRESQNRASFGCCSTREAQPGDPNARGPCGDTLHVHSNNRPLASICPRLPTLVRLIGERDALHTEALPEQERCTTLAVVSESQLKQQPYDALEERAEIRQAMRLRRMRADATAAATPNENAQWNSIDDEADRGMRLRSSDSDQREHRMLFSADAGWRRDRRAQASQAASARERRS